MLMRRFALLLFAIAMAPLALHEPARAGAVMVDLESPVPGHPDVIMFDLVRQLLPDVAAVNGSYEATPPAKLRHVIAAYNEDEDGEDSLTKGSFYRVEVAPLRAGGEERLLVLVDFGTSAETNGFAPLGLFGFDAGAQLLDMANVSLDRDTYFRDEGAFAVSGDESAFATGSYHHNSSQGYGAVALMTVVNDRIELVDDIWMLSDRYCAFDRDQSVALAAGNGGEGHGDIEATVSEIVNPTNENCRDEEDVRVQPSRRDYRVVYHWDAARSAYQPNSDDFIRLAEVNEERY